MFVVHRIIEMKDSDYSETREFYSMQDSIDFAKRIWNLIPIHYSKIYIEEIDIDDADNNRIIWKDGKWKI